MFVVSALLKGRLLHWCERALYHFPRPLTLNRLPAILPDIGAATVSASSFRFAERHHEMTAEDVN